MSSNATNSLLTCISASGNAVFVAGRDALQYQVSPGGAVRIKALDTPLRNALNAIITRASPQKRTRLGLARTFSRTNTRSSRDGRWTWKVWSMAH